MSMITVTEDWPLEQLHKLQRSQPKLVQQAIERLLEDNESLRWSMVVGAYLDQAISLARAALLLGLDPLELRERFVERGVPLLLGPVDLADAQAEVDAMRAWKRTADSDQ